MLVFPMEIRKEQNMKKSKFLVILAVLLVVCAIVPQIAINADADVITQASHSRK